MNHEQMSKIENTIEYFTKRVNECKANGAYEMANEWLDMLLGALSIYEVIIGRACTVEDTYDGGIQVVLYSEK